MQTNLELIRTFILVTGWPILIAGSVYLTIVSIKFYQNIGKTVFGKLVLAMVLGWFVSMYSLGITATAYMFTEVQSGVIVVIPIFVIWFITMFIITWTVLRWSKEAVTLNGFYRGLEELVKKKTEELEKSYQAQIQNEKEIRRLRERFVFVAAHELRTPVTAVEWGLSAMLDDEKLKKLLPDDYMQLLKNLREKNKKLLELMSDLLNVARLQAETLSIEKEDTVFEDLITELRENVKKPAEEKGISIYWPVLDKKLPILKTNKIYLKEILMNLLGNAVNYNKSGGWVRLEAEEQSGKLMIKVKDNGIGVAPQEMEHLFKEFYRIKTAETKNIEGTGLGLFITKELLKRLGEEIKVESEKGKGSTFSFSIPFSKPSHH